MGFSDDYSDIACNHESALSATQYHQMLQVREQETEEAHLDLLHLVMPRDLSHTAVQPQACRKGANVQSLREVF